MNSEPVFLSIIIPAYNEELRLAKTLDQVVAYLQEQTYSYEVIVVENGSTDRTLEIAQNYAGQHRFIQVIKEDGRGKGLAVRRGMLAASGNYRFMCDADLSMPIEEVYRFLPPQVENAEIITNILKFSKNAISINLEQAKIIIESKNVINIQIPKKFKINFP